MYNNIRNYYRFTKRWVKRFSSNINFEPIIVLGKEKSGTTIIASLLADYAGLTVTLDIPPLWGSNEIRIFKGDTSLLEFVQSHKYYFSNDIIKEPSLTFLYNEVKKTFQFAKYVMIIRDPRDNIRSILDRLAIDGNLSGLNNVRIQSMNRGWETVIDGSWLGIPDKSLIEMAAARWNYAAEIYINNRSDFILVKYEEFLQNKIETINNLARDLLLSQTNNIEDKIDIQHQPKGNRSVSWYDFFGKTNLETIENICAGNMSILGYN